MNAPATGGPLRSALRSLAARRIEAAVFLFFLAVALSRKSPYWPHGAEIPWHAGLALALLPLLPGLILRRDEALVKGYLVGLFLPYQSAAALLSCVLLAVLLLRHGRRWLREGAWAPRLRNPMFWGVALLAVACAQWATGITAAHSPASVALAFATILATPLALLLAGRALGEQGATDQVGRFLSAVIVAEALVIVLYPFIIGQPRLLASVVNGTLKPLYTALGRPWDYPWYDPDWNPGSLSIVNYSAVIMAVGAVYFFFGFLRQRKLPPFLAFLLLAFTSVLAENAMATGAAVAAFAVLVVLLLLRRFAFPRLPRRAAIPLAALAVVAALAAFLAVTYTGSGRFARTQKGLYYEQALSQVPRRPLPAILGYGPGAYGSRVAQLRLAGDPYRQTERLAAYPTFGTDFSSLGGDYARDVAAVLQRPALWVGTSQGMLYSGLIPILFEHGVAGIIPILALCLILLSATLPDPIHRGDPGVATENDNEPGTEPALFGLLFLLFLSVFYNYTEIPTVVAVCAMGGALLLFRPRR